MTIKVVDDLLAQIPQRSHCYEWQDLKDVAKGYCPHKHIRRADTVGPHHKFGYIIIGGERNARKAFGLQLCHFVRLLAKICTEQFCLKGISGWSIKISLNGPFTRGEINDSVFQDDPRLIFATRETAGKRQQISVLPQRSPVVSGGHNRHDVSLRPQSK